MQKIIDKMRRGDGLSDDELSRAIRFFAEIVAALSLLGPRYAMACGECARSLENLRTVQAWRNANAYAEK